MKPELEDKEAAVRRMLPKDTEIDRHALEESTDIEFYRGKIEYNSSYNWRHIRKNMVSLSVTTCMLVYIGFLYESLKRPRRE